MVAIGTNNLDINLICEKDEAMLMKTMTTKALYAGDANISMIVCSHPRACYIFLMRFTAVHILIEQE